VLVNTKINLLINPPKRFSSANFAAYPTYYVHKAELIVEGAHINQIERMFTASRTDEYNQYHVWCFIGSIYFLQSNSL
jgi:hypothetical protein